MPKPHLILLHGALGAAAQFTPWLPLLDPHFEVHVLEFEGHGGQAFADRPFGIAHFAGNLADKLAVLGIRDANVFGYSMGGYVAIYLARHQPGLVGRIFTMSSKLDWHAAGAAKEVKMLDVETIRTKVPKFAEMLEARHHGNDWVAHLARTAEMMLALGDNPALSAADFAQLHIPVRLGIGDRDTMVTLEETIAAYRQLPQGQLLVMPNTPHPIEKMDAGKMCAEISAFFSA